MPDFRQSREREWLEQPLLNYQTDPSYTPQDQIGGPGMGGVGNDEHLAASLTNNIDERMGNIMALGDQRRELEDRLAQLHQPQPSGGMDLSGAWQGVKDAGSKGMDLLSRGLSAITPTQEGYNDFAMRLQRAAAIANGQVPLYMREQQQQMEMAQHQEAMQMKRAQLAQQLQEHKQKQEEHQWKQVFSVLGNSNLSDPQQEEMLKRMAKEGHPIAHEASQAVNAKMLGDFKLVQDRLGMSPEEIMDKLQKKEINWHDLAAKVTVEKKNYIQEKESMAHEEGQQKKIQGLYDKFRQDPYSMNDSELELLDKHRTAQKERNLKILQLQEELKGKEMGNAKSQLELQQARIMPQYGPEVHAAGGKVQRDRLDPQTGQLTQVIGEKTPASVTNVNMKQESAFETELGKENVKDIKTTQAKARDSVAIIQNIHEGRKLLDSGMITGVGAEYLTTFGQALQQIGFRKDQDAIKNTQAYGSLMASNVAKHIKEFGAGTGLSDADREYAKKMAGGDITLDEKSIRKILQINEDMSRNLIRNHNKSVKGIKSIIPLTIEEPPEYESPKKKKSGAAPLQQGGPFQDPEKEKRYQEWKRKQGK